MVMKKTGYRKKLRAMRSKKIGMAPGALVYVGEVKAKEVVVTLIEYDAEHIQERTLDAAAIRDYVQPAGQRLWLNVHGLHNPELIADIGHAFNLHALVLEDILNTDQRPKVDSYDEYLYIVTRCFYYEKDQNILSSEQISLILGKDFVLTFQERSSGAFEPIRERMRNGRGQMRAMKSDYLASALLDVIVDRSFLVLEKMSDDAEDLEDVVLHKASVELLHKIHLLKRDSMELRRNVWPFREVLNSLVRNDHGFFEPGTLLYLRDVYDHTVHFIESLEAIRDLLGGMMDIYLSCVSNRVNIEVRTLTVVTMLFMPATLISGIFGMNFHEMPWLAHHDGFWWALGLMAAVAIGMGLIFWRRQWLSTH
jgi:magnesium transporter